MSLRALRRLRRASAAVVLAMACSHPAWAAPTPGYSERVLQWKVQDGETCADIAASLYGSAKEAPLLQRYNDVACAPGQNLEAGRVLVVPEQATRLPPASLYSTSPTVKARAPGAEWTDAASGMPLYRLYSVNTLARARADVRFIDRTRIVLSEHTLVVIYETASASNVTSKPPAVELQEGEVQAGLASLAGRTVAVGVTGGGRVDAKSHDAVLRRTGERTTVSVFDGSARVESAGKKVEVPRNYGSSFVRAKPPTPPRPLPPAPVWANTSSTGIVLITPASSRLNAAWSEVPSAVKYRLEIAHDAAFSELVLREETPPDVRAFRAENFPPGSYYLRVRAVDAEDFLGLASAERQAVLVESKFVGGSVETSVLRGSRYGLLELAPSAELELAVDDGAFGPVVPRIDLLRQNPSSLRFRQKGASNESRVALQYTPVIAHIQPAAPDSRGQLGIAVTLEGVAGIDVPGRVGPKLRVQQDSQVIEVPLTAVDPSGNSWAGTIAAPTGSPARLTVVDSRGRPLGTASVDARLVERAPIRRIGLTSLPQQLDPRYSVPWWSPSFGSAVAVAVAAQAQRGEAQAQVSAQVSGAVGAFGINASIASNGLVSDSPLPVDKAAWLGVGYRFTPPPTMDGQVLGGFGLRLGVPTLSGETTRLEPSVALGARVGRFAWLGNLGGRATLSDSEFQRSLQAFFTLGGTYDVASSARMYTLLDAHLLQFETPEARAGLAFGLEVGTRVFSTLGLRFTPWTDAGGPLFAQLGFGIREF